MNQNPYSESEQNEIPKKGLEALPKDLKEHEDLSKNREKYPRDRKEIIKKVFFSEDPYEQIAERFGFNPAHLRNNICKLKLVWTRKAEYWPENQISSILAAKRKTPPPAPKKPEPKETTPDLKRDIARTRVEKFVKSENPDTDMPIDKKISDRMRLLGAKGGRVRSEKKRIAAKANGLKGGKPKR
ncbi:hypothetical protein MCEMIH22_00282 [Candidatus Methylacidiphilaceae bacterium]